MNRPSNVAGTGHPAAGLAGCRVGVPSAWPAEAPRRSLVSVTAHGVCLLLVTLATSVVAQEAASPAAEPAPAPQLSDRIQYVGPDTYILLDSEGRPQPVPGMTYEDFLAAWKQSQQTAGRDRQPRYTIDRIHLDGQAREGRAELRFTATVRLLDEGAVDVPLGLVGAILQGEPRFERAAQQDVEETVVADLPTEPRRARSGDPRTTESPAPRSLPQDEYVTYDPERGGFVARLAGRAGERRAVTLDLIVPLARDGAEWALPLACPRAASSTMLLIVDTPILAAAVSSGAILAQEPTAEGGTRLEIRGAMGPFRVSWQTSDNGAGELATVLSAVGTIRASIDGRSLRSEARLTVRSYGGSFDRFRVRLPPGAQLVRKGPTDAGPQSAPYRITVESEERGAGSEERGARSGSSDSQLLAPGSPPSPRQIVLVELPEKQQGPVTIELSTEQPIGLEEQGPSVELAGFEVLGAVRQFGDVALDVADDWQARWDIGPYVRQVDPSELEESLAHPGLSAAFQYDRQSWSLGVRIAARRFRVHVTPTYELDYLLDEARLTVHLAYQVFGARAFEFRLRTEGWEMSAEPIESGGLVEQDRIYLAADGTLVLPLAQGATRRAEITLSLRRRPAAARPRDGAAIRLPLPVPLGDSVGTGELIVRAPAEIDLLPDPENATLTPIPGTDVRDAATENHATELRFRCLTPDAVFLAEAVSRTREMIAESAAEIDLTQDAQQTAARVEQRVDYSVRYEPIKELTFEVPSELARDDADIEFVLLSAAESRSTNADDAAGPTVPLRALAVDGRAASGDARDTAPPRVGEGAEEAIAPGGTRRLRVALPQPRLGKFAVRIAYHVRRADGEGGASKTSWQLPLVQPADGQGATSHALVRTPRTISAALAAASGQGSSWKPASSEPDRMEGRFAYEFVADRPESSLPLLLSAADVNLPSATTVERVWLQTWLSAGVRQDRAAYRFRTAAAQTTVELPPQTPSAEVEVLLDGQPADVVSRDGGRIVVRFAEANAGEETATPDVAGLPTELRGAGSGDPRTTVHTLELRYRRPVRDALVTRYQLTPPQIVGTTALSEVYWHIVLPGDEQVVRSPQRMTSASQWQWLGSFWGRRPVMAQADLEAWSGAAAQLSPTVAQNEYLFTGLAPVLSIELVTAPRWLIVLLASSAVLALVVIWIYVPQAQRGWIVVAVACLIAGLAVAFPAPALLVAQASVLGVVGAALSVLIARLVARPRRWPMMLSTGSTQRQATTPRADSFVMPSVVSAASTAPTASLRIQDSE